MQLTRSMGACPAFAGMRRGRDWTSVWVAVEMVMAMVVATTVSIAAPMAEAVAQTRKDSVVIGMTLEPPVMDPTANAAAAVGEIVHYNVLEGLTKVRMDGSVVPLLAESWTIEPDGKRYRFKLRQGVKFQDGEDFDATDVKFSFERAKAEGSVNKAKKGVFDNIVRIDTPDRYTVLLELGQADGSLLFRLGENTAVIFDPKSVDKAGTKPVGTGPFRFEAWSRGTSVTLSRWEGYRDAPAVKLKKVNFRFINDPAAQVAALLAGDVDAIPRFNAPESIGQFRADARFSVVVGGTEGKTIVAINNRKKPLDDVRVRRAIAAAIDRKALIDGSQQGQGAPIGSHLVPSDAGYIDLTGVNPYNPARAKALLKEAGVALPLKLSLTLPPPQYARKGGEIVAAQLAQVGIEAKIENVEWAQWLSGTFKGRFDLSIISHVEPLDFAVYADPAYYFGYDSPSYRSQLAAYNAATADKERLKLLGDLQRQLATDAVNAYLFQLPQFTVAQKKLHGLWVSSPIFANDMAAVSWQ